jgi:hypothetical protein
MTQNTILLLKEASEIYTQLIVNQIQIALRSQTKHGSKQFIIRKMLNSASGALVKESKHSKSTLKRA